MSDFAIPGLMPRAGTPASIPTLRPPQGEPLDTERQLKAVVDDLVRARKQRDYDFLSRAAASGTMQQLQAEKLRELAGGDTQQAMQFASLGMAMEGEGWRVPETQLRYGDMLADLEAMGGAQYPEEMAGLRQQFEQSKGLAAALNVDQQTLAAQMWGDLGDQGPMTRAGNLLESMLAASTMGLVGTAGDRRSRMVNKLVQSAQRIAAQRYENEGEAADPWGLRPVPKREDYERMLLRGVVSDLRDQAMKHPDLQVHGGEKFANEVAGLAGMLLPMGAVSKAVGATVKGIVRVTGLGSGLAKVLGEAGAKVVTGGLSIGSQAATLGALGAAMPPSSEQETWLSIDVEKQIRAAGMAGEEADAARRAAKAAVSFQNAMSMGVMVPAMALVGPIAGKLGTAAGKLMGKAAGPTSAWALERLAGGAGVGASMPAVMEFANTVSERVAKAAEGSKGLFEDVGRASQLGMIADSHDARPVHDFLLAASNGDVAGMGAALQKYGEQAAAPAATFGAMELLGLVHSYAGTKLRQNSRSDWNMLIDDTGGRAKEAAKKGVSPEMRAELEKEGISQAQFEKAVDDLVDSQVKQLTLEEPAKTKADEVRSEPGGTEAIDEDVTVRVTEDSTAPTAKSSEAALQPGEEDAPRTIDQAIEDTHRAEDAAQEQIQIATEEHGAPTPAEVAKQGLVRTERRILALEKQARNLDLSQPARERAAQMAAELRQYAREHRDWIEGGAAADMEPPAPDMAPRGGLAREAAQSLVQGPPREEAAAGRVKARKGSAAAMLEETNLEFRRQAERINQAADLARRDDAEPGERQAATKVVTEGRVALKRWVGELPTGTRVQDALGNRWTLLEPAQGQGEGIWKAVDENGRVVERWNPDEWILGAPERVEFHSRVPKRELQALKNDVDSKARAVVRPANAPEATVVPNVGATKGPAAGDRKSASRRGRRAEKESPPKALEQQRQGEIAPDQEISLDELRDHLDQTTKDFDSTPEGPTKRQHARLIEELTEEIQRRSGERDPNDTSEEDFAELQAALGSLQGPPHEVAPEASAVVAAEVIGKPEVAKVVEADAAKDGKASQKERSKRRQAGDGKAAKADSESVRGKAKREKEVKSDTPAKLLEVRPVLNRLRSLKTPQQRALWKVVKHMPASSWAELIRVAREGGSAPVPGIKVDPLPTLQALDLLDTAATAKANGVAWANADGAKLLVAMNELGDVRRTWGIEWGLDESVKRRKPAPKVYEPTNDELQGPINKSLPWKFVQAAVAREETRYAINGVQVKDGWMAGTNGRVLHAIRIGKGYGDSRTVAFDGIRTLEDRFPEWQQIIPKDAKPFGRYRIADLLQLVESLPVPIDGSTEVGQVALFEVARRRGNVPITINAELLQDALRAFHELGHEEVEASGVDHHQPIVLKAPGRGDAVVLIMPISADVAPKALPAVGTVKMPGWEYVDVRHIQNLGVAEAAPKPVKALPRPGGPFEIPAKEVDHLERMQRTSDVAAELAADLIDSGTLSDHRDFAEALVDGLKEAGLWKDKSVDPYYGQHLGTVIDTITSREAHAAKQGPGAYAQFLASIREDVLHGPIGVALQYYEPGSKLIGRIVRNARKLRETDPGNPEAGAMNIGAILDIPGALWGHVRRFFADVFKPKVVEGLVAEMESAPKDRLGTVRRFLAQRGLMPPQSFAGFIARDGIRAVEEGVGAVEQYRRQLFGAGGLLDGIAEGSEASARIFDALDNPREIVRHEVVGMGVVEEVHDPHPAWAALQPNELEIANKLRELFEEFRVHLASVHPRAVRLREEAERTGEDLGHVQADVARVERERDAAKALWESLPDAQAFESMRQAERAARKEAKKEGKSYETPRAFVEELADLQELALGAMHDAGFKGGPATYNGILSRLSRKQNMLQQRREALQKAHDQIISGYGLRNYVHHVIDVDASLDDLRDLFSGPALRNEGRMGRRQGWSDAQLRLDRKHAPRAGIGAKRTGKLEESGLLARDIVRSVWDYIHTFPVYLKRLEFMARYDRYLNGALEGAKPKVNEEGGFAGHEAFDPHSEVIYHATAARSFGRMVARFDSEGNVSFHRWQSLTDEERADVTQAKLDNKAFRARQRTLGLDPGPSEARMDRVVLWLGSEDPIYAPTWERLADPLWVAGQMHAEGDDVGPTRVPLLLALELEDAKNGIRLWRNGWYGRVLELADRARELGENPADYKVAAENLARYIDEQILGASAEAATGLVHELGEEGLRVADNARQAFERVGSMVAAGLSAHAIGGPTNIRNALQAGGGGLILAYASMGKLPSRVAISAMRRYGKAQSILRGLEQGFMKKLLRMVRIGVGGRKQLDLRTMADQVGGWKHLNAAIETMELTPPDKLAKMGDEERNQHLFADEAIREALRLNLTGGNRGDQIGRMLDWTTQYLRGSGELRRRSFDVRRGEIVREGRLSMTNLLRKLSDAFWYPFNLGERFARVMPFIEQYVEARKAGADRAQASNRAFDFMQQAQLVYSRAAKMRAWNHPIMRMLSAITTWAAHAETRFGLALGSMGPLSFGSRLGLWARLAAVVFIGWQLGIDLTRMSMSATPDVAGIGQAATGVAGGVVPTADDPIGTQPKGPFGRGYVDIGTPEFDIPGIDIPLEHGRIATPNVPWPGFLTGPGPFFDLLGDLASSVAHLRYGDGAAAADSLASGFSNINPFSSSASWLKRLRPSFEAERNTEGGFTWRDGDSTIRQWEKHPGLFSQGLDALGIEADWIDRFDLWASAQLPASRETHSWISAILEHESSRMHDAAAQRAARTAEDLAWWDKKLQAATDPAEREVLQKQRDELGQQWFSQRLQLGLPNDAEQARSELRSSLRSAERRSAIMHEVPARLRVVAYAGSRRQQVEALTRVLEDPYQLITDDNLRVLSEAVWPQDGIQGVLRDDTIPQASREALFKALQAKLKH